LADGFGNGNAFGTRKCLKIGCLVVRHRLTRPALPSGRGRDGVERQNSEGN
jgi:hypothetical protein